jgi:hypothetical protein
MSETWELFALTPHPQKPKEKMLAWKVKSAQSTLHSKHNFLQKHPSPPLHPQEEREAPSLNDMTSHWLHGNSILKIFWPGLMALPKNTLPICL